MSRLMYVYKDGVRRGISKRMWAEWRDKGWSQEPSKPPSRYRQALRYGTANYEHVIKETPPPKGSSVMIALDRLGYKWQGRESDRSPPPEQRTPNWVWDFEFEKRLAGEQTREKLRETYPALVSLYEDIRDNGMVNPLVVMPWDEPNKPPFIVLVGNQRLAVARALGWKEAPCLVGDPQKDDWTDATRLRVEHYQWVKYDEDADTWRRLE